MNKLVISTILTALLIICSTQARAMQSRYIPPEGNYAAKIDGYNYFVDYSGSIMMKHKGTNKKKIEMIRQVLTDINAMLPALEYKAGLYTFAPYTQKIGTAPWDRRLMQRGIDDLRINLDIFARATDLGDAFISHNSILQNLSGKKALLIFTDGETNRGPNPVIEAKKLLEENPNLCLHFVSVADSEHGQAMIDAMGRLKKCTLSVKAEDIIKDEAALRQFVSDIFYEEKLEEVIVLRGVNFAFDSSGIEPTAEGLLNEVVIAVQREPKSLILLNGYTDAFGTDKYNQELSQRRADAVLRYLAARGVDPRRIVSRGMGKSYTYDNSTEEGCYMNRRVEISFIE